MSTPAHLDRSENTINPGWEERFAKVSVGNFHVEITYDESLFTPEEVERNKIKLQIVAEYAAELAYGMSKGSVKYLTDLRTPDEWWDFEREEANDQVNYRLLARAAERGLTGVSKTD